MQRKADVEVCARSEGEGGAARIPLRGPKMLYISRWTNTGGQRMGEDFRVQKWLHGCG